MSLQRFGFQTIADLDRRWAAVYAMMAGPVSAEVQEYAQRNAPWQNQTGNARRLLHASARPAGREVWLRLSHGVEYGIWLEVARGGPYQIIKPTLDAMRPRITHHINLVFWGA